MPMDRQVRIGNEVTNYTYVQCYAGPEPPWGRLGGGGLFNYQMLHMNFLRKLNHEAQAVPSISHQLIKGCEQYSSDFWSLALLAKT